MYALNECNGNQENYNTIFQIAKKGPFGHPYMFGVVVWLFGICYAYKINIEHYYIKLGLVTINT